MNRCLSLIITAGLLIASGGLALQRYLVWENRFQTGEELSVLDSQKQTEETLAYLRSRAKTPDDRLFVEFLTRTKSAELREKEKRRFKISDGVDQFEAWLLATTYFPVTYGSCGAVDLPHLESGRWRVRAAVGRNARFVAIFVDSKTGRVESEGQEPVIDAMAFMQNPIRPNQAPEATPGLGSP